MFLSFHGIMLRVVLTHYKIHDKKKNIEAVQQTNTDDDKCF